MESLHEDTGAPTTSCARPYRCLGQHDEVHNVRERGWSGSDGIRPGARILLVYFSAILFTSFLVI